MQNYIITGATGLLGSHIVYELVRLKLVTDRVGDIALLIRNKGISSAEGRLASIFRSELIPDYLSEFDKDELVSQCKIISCDLRDLSGVQPDEIPSNAILIHAGSSVNLGTDNGAQKEVFDNNYSSTLNLFNLLKSKINTFVFVSTAFSSGHREGKIDNDFLTRKNNSHRNFYETFKSILEKELDNLCNKENINFKVMRPSVICGRLIDAPKFVINKFLVFYLFGYFFHELVRKNKVGNPIRIYLTKQASLNIVPVDYVAKAIVKSATNTEIKQLNIVSKNQTSLEVIMKLMLDHVGFSNYRFVYEAPEKLNISEKNYYRWIDSQLHAYIHTPQHYFDTTELEKIQPQDENLKVQNHFNPIFKYALDKDFKHE